MARDVTEQFNLFLSFFYSGLVLLEPTLPKHQRIPVVMMTIYLGDRQLVSSGDGTKVVRMGLLAVIDRADWATIYPPDEVASIQLGSRHRVMQEPSSEVQGKSFFHDVQK